MKNKSQIDNKHTLEKFRTTVRINYFVGICKNLIILLIFGKITNVQAASK